MISKDLDTINHIVFFSSEELDKGYDYCNSIMEGLKNRFPGHHFMLLPDTIAVKELGSESVRMMIEELQKYLELISKEANTK